MLENGRELWIRPIQAEDAIPLRAAFSLLTPEEIRQRFQFGLREISEAYANRLATPDTTREFALVAAEPLPPGEALIGAVVRAAVDPDGRHAEFAIIVTHFLAGQGLGRYLMKRVIRWARLKRLDSLYGDVLEDNLPMLTLARSLGFRRDRQAPAPGVTRVRLALGKKPGGTR